jgi:hypothetical protein
LQGYHDLAPSQFCAMKNETCTKHIRHIRIQGDMNNKMEHMNGEIRDREGVGRGLKKEDDPLIKGLQMYHNKWITLIQNASRSRRNQLQRETNPLNRREMSRQKFRFMGARSDVEWALVSTIEESGRTVFLCDVCGVGYPDEATAQECQNWCEKHSSCNLAITRKAIHRPS